MALFLDLFLSMFIVAIQKGFSFGYVDFLYWYFAECICQLDEFSSGILNVENHIVCK